MKRGRAKPKPKPEPLVPDRTPLISDTPRQFIVPNNRDSDASHASYASNRPSPSASRNIPINDKAYQHSALRTINDYLSSHNQPFHLNPPYPSAKDIILTIHFVLSRMDWPTDNIKLEDDLPALLKHLNYPLKFNKSALKSPGTPHTWPSLLAVIHWLVQIALYNDHISGDSSLTTTTKYSSFQENEFLMYALESYSYYIDGNDDAVDALDAKFIGRLEEKNDAVIDEVRKKEKEALDLEEKLQRMRSAPSVKEARERDKTVLEEDIRKFHAMIDQFNSNIATLEKDMERMETELEVKKSENQRICEENEELKKTLEAQMFNLRDVEKMRREIQILDREISEAEAARNEWEEKSWDLDAALGQKLKELESLSIDGNQAIRRLKIGDDMQYKVNIKGSKPDDILGNDYKTTLKPALITLAEDLKKSSMEKLEELISLQQQSQDNQSKLKEKRTRLTEIQSQINAIESQLSSMRKELAEYTSVCHMESKRLTEEFEEERHKLDIMGRKAEDAIKSSQGKLDLAIKQSDEELQKCARELLMLVDSVSKYKESMESTVLDMRKELSDTVEAVTNAYNSSLTEKEFSDTCSNSK